ncbi:MAG: hypothetical protein GX410_10555 [Elusimicrobia bacterium]|nr:hypothetical protein [Elusimicrobiota bacterium]
MKYEIKYLSPVSLVLSSVPLVLFCLGAIGGLLAFVIVPNPQIEPMTSMGRLMATGVFAVLYMLVIMALMVISAVVYNIFTYGLGLRGVVVRLAEAEDYSADSADAA